MKKGIILFAIIMGISMFAGCGTSTDEQKGDANSPAVSADSNANQPGNQAESNVYEKDYVKVTVKDGWNVVAYDETKPKGTVRIDKKAEGGALHNITISSEKGTTEESVQHKIKTFKAEQLDNITINETEYSVAADNKDIKSTWLIAPSTEGNCVEISLSRATIEEAMPILESITIKK